MAQIKKKGEFAGAGALVQALGLILMFVLFPLGGIVAGVFGILAGLILLIIGSRMSYKYICSECGNKVDKDVKMCPVCKAEFEK